MKRFCLTLLWLWDFLDDLSPFNQQTARHLKVYLKNFNATRYKWRKLHSIYISSELLNGKLFEMKNSLRMIRCERWCVKDLKSFLIYFIIRKLYKHERKSCSFVQNELSFPTVKLLIFNAQCFEWLLKMFLNRKHEWNSMQISPRFFLSFKAQRNWK